MASGDIGRLAAASPSRGAFAISQFWQNTQWNGQPAAAMEDAGDPGSTWHSGFRSIGSRLVAATVP